MTFGARFSQVATLLPVNSNDISTSIDDLLFCPPLTRLKSLQERPKHCQSLA